MHRVYSVRGLRLYELLRMQQDAPNPFVLSPATNVRETSRFAQDFHFLLTPNARSTIETL